MQNIGRLLRWETPAAQLWRYAAPLSTSGTTSARTMAIERDSGQSAPPKPVEPFVEEDNQGNIENVAHSYEQVLAEHSGTAEDVRVKDHASSTLTAMATDPTAVDEPYKQRARDSVGGMEGVAEDPDIAAAVMDTEEGTRHAMQDKGISGHKDTFPKTATATPPK